jgi:hypothetical protein
LVAKKCEDLSSSAAAAEEDRDVFFFDFQDQTLAVPQLWNDYWKRDATLPRCDEGGYSGKLSTDMIDEGDLGVCIAFEIFTTV